MKNFKKYAMAVALLIGGTTVGIAQEYETDYTSAHNFVGLQAGGQVTLTHYNLGKLVTPQFAIQFGRYFNDKVGARLHVMGYQGKTGLQASQYTDYGLTQDVDFKYKACTADIDLLMNMTNIINPQRTNRAFDWVLLCGFGVNYIWDYADIDQALKALPAYGGSYYHNKSEKMSGFNGRLGTQFNYNISEHFTVGLELQANYKNDNYNVKINDRCDWQIVALAGVSYNFGYKHNKKAVVVKEPVYTTRIDTVWYDDVTYKTVPEQKTSTSNIRFAICKSNITDAPEIAQIADFVKNNKECKVTVTGYADKGTGNPKVNMKYSKQRAETVTKALVDAGVPAGIITTEWKGDTVQPFPVNDDNRVAVTVATGTGEKKEKVVTKKFRTKEVRYEVK